MSTHVFGLTIRTLTDAANAARIVDHTVTIIDDADHIVFVIDPQGHVIARPERDER